MFEGHGPPNDIGFLPDDITNPAAYWDLDVGVVYVWNVQNQTWE